MTERPPFPFIVGCGRSGTTLLRAILDAHPDVAVPFESYFPVWFARRRRRYEQARGFATDVFVDDLLGHESFARWGLDEATVRAGLDAAAPATYPDAVRACYALYARAHDKPRYADKTPAFVEHIPVVASLFPEAVFVHIVRDGRNVVLSRTAAAWGSDRIAAEALLWQTQVSAGRTHGARLGPDRYLEVRYEDLVDDAEPVVRRICAFARIDFDSAMLGYHERATNVLADQPFPQEHQNLLRPPTKGLRDWRTELSPRDIERVEAIAGTTLSALGYERAIDSPRWAARADAGVERLRFQCARQYRRARRAVWHLTHAARSG